MIRPQTFLAAAVAEEKKRQRDGLKKQRDQYIGRSEKMKRELKELKQQKADLSAGHGKNQRSPSPKTNGFIKENEKLQVRFELQTPEKDQNMVQSIRVVCLCLFFWETAQSHRKLFHLRLKSKSTKILNSK